MTPERYTRDDLLQAVDIIEHVLCEKIDSQVYIPTKEELEGRVRGTYRLGQRKERYKVTIMESMDWLRKRIRA